MFADILHAVSAMSYLVSFHVTGLFPYLLKVFEITLSCNICLFCYNKILAHKARSI